MLLCKHIHRKPPVHIRGRREHCLGRDPAFCEPRRQTLRQLIGPAQMARQQGDHKPSLLIGCQNRRIRFFIPDIRSNGPDSNAAGSDKNKAVRVSKPFSGPGRKPALLHRGKADLMIQGGCLHGVPPRNPGTGTMALCLQELYQPLFHLKPIFCKADQSDLHLVSSILCRSAYIIGSFFSSFNVWFFPFCPAISRFFLVIRPPIRPLSLAVRHLHPPATTLSARPSSAAISNFSMSSGFRLLGSTGSCFFFPMASGSPLFLFLRKVFPETGSLYRSLPDPYASRKARHISFSERGAGHGKSPAPETLSAAAEKNRDRTAWLCPGPHICSGRFLIRTAGNNDRCDDIGNEPRPGEGQDRP